MLSQFCTSYGGRIKIDFEPEFSGETSSVHLILPQSFFSDSRCYYYTIPLTSAIHRTAKGRSKIQEELSPRKRGTEEHQKTQTPLAEQRRDLLPPVVFFAPIHMAITMIQSRFNHDHTRSGSPMVLPAGPSVEASSPMPSSTTPRAAFENPCG
ncbi:hypothetical protein RYX36_008247 [Vicia faba]